MSVTPIRLYHDPVLHQPAAPVVDFDQELRQLVTDLTETMQAAGGAGLAAPQIGVGLRVFTWYVDGEVGHLVNPDVVPVGEEVQDGPEGCLSIPDLRYDCRRHLHVVASGWNVHGDPVRVEGSELLARAIQHETDHLDGVLFVDRLADADRVAALAEIQAAEWAGYGSYLPVVKVSPH
ncbi:peptide deformylase [Blastococcus sp. VKM Ac-2987]|uniref:peptide deformylase n=1 Tax=Blastococcus sp. VKM Ac-2987 TaxID=3004141 RepID=UPI0022AB59EC|nr:peptide deformylase [Blastococcus sp. VKM Ac-2987]MCZ2861180.1 peptide deformylase [Blastococcus sp. VKM Ac-2987]